MKKKFKVFCSNYTQDRKATTTSSNWLKKEVKWGIEREQREKSMYKKQLSNKGKLK